MVGKPVDGVARDTNVLIRVKTEERSRWHAAAKRAGLTLSAWLRALANEAAGSTKGRRK